MGGAGWVLRRLPAPAAVPAGLPAPARRLSCVPAGDVLASPWSPEQGGRGGHSSTATMLLCRNRGPLEVRENTEGGRGQRDRQRDGGKLQDWGNPYPLPAHCTGCSAWVCRDRDSVHLLVKRHRPQAQPDCPKVPHHSPVPGTAPLPRRGEVSGARVPQWTVCWSPGRAGSAQHWPQIPQEM